MLAQDVRSPLPLTPKALAALDLHLYPDSQQRKFRAALSEYTGRPIDNIIGGAGADEIIVGAEFSSRVISTATLDHGISTVLRELLSAQVGHDLITVPVPVDLAGRPFFEVFCDLKRDHGMIAMAILPDGASAADVVTNPAGDVIVGDSDRLVVVSAGSRQVL